MRHLWLLGILLLGGCISYEPHAWTRGHPQPENRQQLPFDRISAVKAEAMPEAVALLESSDYVLLDDASLALLAKHPLRRVAGENAYLVRAVSWSEPPLFRTIYFDGASRTLYVDSYTFNGEIFIPGKRVSEPSPIIVCLDFVPSAVIPDAIIGGDRILALSFRDEAWTKERDE
jgi:hypothetical protein